jgi:hypothetical protein
MIVSGWSNGSPNIETGAGYGVRVRLVDRDRHFRAEWSSTVIELDDGNRIEVNLSDAFWRGCAELRKREIGRWMLNRGLAPWPRGNPPRLRLEPIGERTFRLTSS